jgi:hypothetical protein
MNERKSVKNQSATRGYKANEDGKIETGVQMVGIFAHWALSTPLPPPSSRFSLAPPTNANKHSVRTQDDCEISTECGELFSCKPCLVRLDSRLTLSHFCPFLKSLFFLMALQIKESTGTPPKDSES